MTAITGIQGISEGLAKLDLQGLRSVGNISSTQEGATRPAGASSPDGSFAGALQDAFNSMIDRQRTADRAVLELASGRRDDIALVMIDVQKASIALQFGLEARNKVLEAYHEITRTSV